MPSYEMTLIIRKLPRSELVAVLKRATSYIFKNNGILFGIENLGTRALPYRMRAHKNWNSEGSYFLLKFDSPSQSIMELRDENRRDVDIIRHAYVNLEAPEKFDCTLEEEMKPPAYRADVQEMMKAGEQNEKNFKFHTGLSYNPFRT